MSCFSVLFIKLGLFLIDLACTLVGFQDLMFSRNCTQDLILGLDLPNSASNIILCLLYN